MKKNYLNLIIIIICIVGMNANAQYVNISGACVMTIDGDYYEATNVNGRPSYEHGGGTFTISWSGSRWEVKGSGPSVGMYNDLDTPTPPATSLSPWTPDSCSPAGTFTGDATTTTLGLSNRELVGDELKLYPNPASDFITVFGLRGESAYKVSNLLGKIVYEGVTSNDKQVNVKHLPVGVYLLKFENGNSIKFIKE